MKSFLWITALVAAIKPVLSDHCYVSPVQVEECGSAGNWTVISFFVDPGIDIDENSTITDGNGTTTTPTGCDYEIVVGWGNGGITATFFRGELLQNDTITDDADENVGLVKLSLQAGYTDPGRYEIIFLATAYEDGIPDFVLDRIPSIPSTATPSLIVDISEDDCQEVDLSNGSAAPKSPFYLSALSGGLMVLAMTAFFGYC